MYLLANPFGCIFYLGRLGRVVFSSWLWKNLLEAQTKSSRCIFIFDILSFDLSEPDTDPMNTCWLVSSITSCFLLKIFAPIIGKKGKSDTFVQIIVRACV